MKKILIAIIVAVVGALVFQQCRIKKLTQENDNLSATRNVLLDSVKHYKTESGLNAAKVGELRLTLDEVKKYRADDYNTIQSLKKNRDAERYTSVEVHTTDTLFSYLTDTCYIKETDTIRVKSVDIDKKWYSLHGFVNDSIFKGNLTTRDDIRVLVTVKYKRFLGFLWKTNKVKNRQVDVISNNPNTIIDNVEYIVIEE